MLDLSRGLDAERSRKRLAGAFLMAGEALRLQVGKRRSALALGEIRALKCVFGVSIQALTHRCRDLDIIGAAT